MSWSERARCRGMSLEHFFPRRGQSGAIAKRVCARCPVRRECAAEAARFPTSGIWGGRVWNNGRPERDAGTPRGVYTEQQRQDAIALYGTLRRNQPSDRAACLAVAASLGVGESSVREWIRSEFTAAERRMGYNAVQIAERRAAALAMLREILPAHPHETAAMRAVAAEFGVHHETVRDWKRDADKALGREAVGASG
jgi:transposase